MILSNLSCYLWILNVRLQKPCTYLILIKIFQKTQDTPTFLGSFSLSHPNKMHSGLRIVLPHTHVFGIKRVVINFLQSVTLKKKINSVSVRP